MSPSQIQITEEQANALQEILLAYEEANRVPETPSEQIVFPVEPQAAEVTPPWVMKLWATLIDRIPKNPKSVRGNDGNDYSQLHIHPSDIAKLKGITQTPTEIKYAGERYDHPMVMMGTFVDNKYHVRIYDKARW